MAGEIKIATGTPKTLEANGASIANNAIAQANDASYGIVADGASFPHAKFVASFTFSVAPTEGTIIELRARPLNIDSTNDTEAPETTRTPVYIGAYEVNNVTTAQYAEIVARDVPWEADYYLYNNGTGQTISAGWTLKVTPWTYLPGT
jgi:hypothetical protein